jgi:hypothetical protein
MPGTSAAGPLGLTPPPAIDQGTRAVIPSPVPTSVGLAKTPLATSVASDAASPKSDPDIEALDLRGEAKKAAYALKKAHPAVRFTSGRRDKAAQASAMASNVVKSKNRRWIEKTYKSTVVSRACQQWLDDNPDKLTKDAIAEGLLSVLDAQADDDLALLSKHLSGDAFDVQPVETDADAIKETLRDLAGPDNFLDMEGGLVRWHAQF